MYDILQVTMEYSNAVLVAILPYVSEFAGRLDLPLSIPVTTNAVRRFTCSPRSDLVGGRVDLTNGDTFSFVDGRIGLYRSSRSYFSLQDPGRVPEFYGQVHLTEAQALRVGREAMHGLGYTDDVAHLDRPPVVTGPPRIGTNYVPRYRFRWPSLDLEIDAGNGQVKMMALLSHETARPPPVINVHPPVVGSGHRSKPVGGRRIEPVSLDYTNEFFAAILPQIASFATAVGFSIPSPLTVSDIDQARSTCGLIAGYPFAQVYLRTGECFQYHHGNVTSGFARDAFRMPDARENRAEDFLGQVKLTPEEAVVLARSAIRKLGYDEKTLHTDQPPVIVKPTGIGTNFFARYWIDWVNPRFHDVYFVVSEIDAANQRVTSVYINDYLLTNIWRAPPKISAKDGTKASH